LLGDRASKKLRPATPITKFHALEVAPLATTTWRLRGQVNRRAIRDSWATSL